MKALSQNKETLLSLMATLSGSMDDYLFLWDLEENRFHFFGDVSERYALQDKGVSSCAPDEILEIIYPKDQKDLKVALHRVLKEKQDIPWLECRCFDRKGNVVWFNCRGKLQKDENGQPFALVGRISDTMLQPKVDPLTGLFNRSKLADDLDDFLASNMPGYLMFLGMDDFKNINIRYGRTYGDQILKQFAMKLEAVVSNTKQLYRLYSDRFAIHLPNAEREEAERIFRQLQEEISEDYTISAGAVSYRDVPAGDKSEVHQYAENALDKAKKTGKNRIAFFSEEDFLKKLSEVELLAEIRESVKNGCEGFSLVYQPQVNARDHSIYGAEALLRYESPSRGRVFPDEFIPALEKSRLICPVGLWVIETALRACKQWRQFIPSFHISVNVSYVQLKQTDIAERVLEILEKSGLPGEALTLEVTESVQLQEFASLNEIFRKWKNVGIEISVDDFGTGYSSLSYLKNLQIDEVKIDRCFVAGLQFSSYNYRLISNMLELARSAEIRVCCEGVEREDEMKILKGLYTNLLQGYLFSKPREEEEFRELYIEPAVPEYYERILSVQSAPAGAGEKPAGERRSSMLRADECLAIRARADLGVWTFLLDPETGVNEMYIDETMRQLMAADGDLTPEECYLHWYNHINDGYYDYVNQSVGKALESGIMVQLEYTWNHPAFGDVTVRCNGKRIENVDGKTCMVGYHKILNSIEATKFLTDAPTTERFEYNQVREQIYFHTGRHLLEGDQIRESNFPAGWVKSQLVHPQCAEAFREIFRDVHIKENINDIRMLLKSKDGEYAWFKLSTRHLGEKGTDRNTILVLLDVVKD